MKLSVVRSHVRHEGLTIDVYCSEDDAVKGSDGREKQCSCQASVPEPFCFSSKHAGYDEHVVSIKKGVEVTVSPPVRRSGCA
jgi:hypothetical protein